MPSGFGYLKCQRFSSGVTGDFLRWLTTLSRASTLLQRCVSVQPHCGPLSTRLIHDEFRGEGMKVLLSLLSLYPGYLIAESPSMGLFLPRCIQCTWITKSRSSLSTQQDAKSRTFYPNDLASKAQDPGCWLHLPSFSLPPICPCDYLLNSLLESPGLYWVCLLTTVDCVWGGVE